LTAGEATLLAVLPRSPSGYDPRRNLDLALQRRSHVLALMQPSGLALGRPAGPHRGRARHHRGGGRPSAEAPHFSQWALAQLEPSPGGGARRTTLDLPLQRRLETGGRRAPAQPRLGGICARRAWWWSIRQRRRAGHGGLGDHRAADAGQVNIATAPRHPGSTLKPFVYALAIEGGAHPASIADDRWGAIPGYRPHRRMRERGPSRYRRRWPGRSIWRPSTCWPGGGAPLLERLRQAHLGPLAGSSSDYGLDLALGSARVRLVDLAAAYGFLVNGGRVFRARAVQAAADPGVQLFDPVTSWLVMDMLADPAARRSAFGAELPLDLPFPVAAKTGTSSGVRRHVHRGRHPRGGRRRLGRGLRRHGHPRAPGDVERRPAGPGRPAGSRGSARGPPDPATATPGRGDPPRSAR
jgi:penicillin-binding protein 1C